MDEENNFSVDTEQLKSETKDTINQVKDTIKNADFKEGAQQTKGFIMEMFENPISAVKKVASGEENVLVKAIIIMILFIGASFAGKIIYLIRYGSFSRIGTNLFSIVVSILNPVFFMLVPALVVLIFNKANKKPLITVLSTIIIAGVPYVINELLYALYTLIPGITVVVSPFTTMFSAIGLVLTYFGMKELCGVPEDENFVKKFAIIKLISAIILVVLGQIGIY